MVVFCSAETSTVLTEARAVRRHPGVRRGGGGLGARVGRRRGAGMALGARGARCTRGRGAGLRAGRAAAGALAAWPTANLHAARRPRGPV